MNVAGVALPHKAYTPRPPLKGKEEKVEEKHRGTKEYCLTYCQLIDAAQKGEMVHYKEVAHIMGLSLKGHHWRTETGHLVGEISKEEDFWGRPMLSALVVAEASGYPGEGFYSLAKDLGKLGDDSAEGRRRFWEAEIAEVYKEWQGERGE